MKCRSKPQHPLPLRDAYGGSDSVALGSRIGEIRDSGSVDFSPTLTETRKKRGNAVRFQPSLYLRLT